MAEEDSGQTSRRIDLRGPEYRGSPGLTVGVAIVAQEEEGSIVVHAAPVDLAEEGLLKVEEERNWYAKDAGWLRMSCHRTAGASLTAVEDLHRESLAVADASRTAGLRRNVVGHHTADHPIAVGAHYRIGASLAAGASQMTDSALIGAENHAASAGLARACCKNAIQQQVVLMEPKEQSLVGCKWELVQSMFPRPAAAVQSYSQSWSFVPMASLVLRMTLHSVFVNLHCCHAFLRTCLLHHP